MKKFFHPFLSLPLLALGFATSFALHAQPAPAEPTAPTTPAAPAAAATAATPATADDPTKLRRLDMPAAAETSAEPPAPAKAKKTRAQQVKERLDAAKERSRELAAKRTGNEVVNVFGDAYLEAGQKADAVVAVFGSATAEGEVMDSVVSVFGANRATGPVHGEVVAVFGNSFVNTTVDRDVVVVLGNLELGPEARIGGEVVCIGGSITRDPAATVARGTTNVLSVNVAWLTGWIEQCLLKARPLAFDKRVAWAWATAASFLAFYVLIALLFPRAVNACVDTLETKPGFSVLASILTVLLTPVAVVVLMITVVGAVLVPFLGAALMFAGLFGKIVMLAWMGRRLTKFFGDGPLGLPVVSVLVGGALTLLIYTIPFAGFLFYKLLSWVGLGAVVYTVAMAMKREKAFAPAASTPSAPPPPNPGSVAPVAAFASPAPVGDAANMSGGFVGSGVVAGNISAPPPMMPPPAAALFASPPISSATAIAWERAGFFIRLGALALDGVLIGALLVFASGLTPRFLNSHGPEGFLLVLAVYGAVLWKLKGTTIGGIVCGLKVVRIDRREIDWATAIVRALACFLSLMVAGLGFIWVAFDDEQQSWHDKIAGTTVVRAPKGTSLV